MGLYGVVDLSIDIWERFQTSPTVISMDRNKFFWNTSFPSLTVKILLKLQKRYFYQMYLIDLNCRFALLVELMIFY